MQVGKEFLSSPLLSSPILSSPDNEHKVARNM
jgi:hypothetical protein